MSDPQGYIRATSLKRTHDASEALDDLFSFEPVPGYPSSLTDDNTAFPTSPPPKRRRKNPGISATPRIQLQQGSSRTSMVPAMTYPAPTQNVNMPTDPRQAPMTSVQQTPTIRYVDMQPSQSSTRSTGAIRENVTSTQEQVVHPIAQQPCRTQKSHRKTLYENFPSVDVQLPDQISLADMCRYYPNHLWDERLRQLMAAGWTGKRIWEHLPEEVKQHGACNRARTADKPYGDRPYNFMERRITEERKVMKTERKTRAAAADAAAAEQATAGLSNRIPLTEPQHHINIPHLTNQYDSSDLGQQSIHRPFVPQVSPPKQQFSAARSLAEGGQNSSASFQYRPSTDDQFGAPTSTRQHPASADASTIVTSQMEPFSALSSSDVRGFYDLTGMSRGQDPWEGDVPLDVDRVTVSVLRGMLKVHLNKQLMIIKRQFELTTPTWAGMTRYAMDDAAVEEWFRRVKALEASFIARWCPDKRRTSIEPSSMTAMMQRLNHFMRIVQDKDDFLDVLGDQLYFVTNWTDEWKDDLQKTRTQIDSINRAISAQDGIAPTTT